MKRLCALFWVDDPAAYRDAMTAAGLAGRVQAVFLKRGEMPPGRILESAELLAGWPPAPGALARMPRLRWIQSLSVGMSTWLKRSDLRQEVMLTCARGIHRVQMPENILGALFHVTKHFSEHAANQAASRWARRVSEPLAGKTLGILGLGAIGTELAAKAAALEIRVVGTKRIEHPLAGIDRVRPPEATDEILAESDYVVLLLPDTRETEGFMDARRFAAMKRGAWLLNFARGALVVDKDLIDAVTTGTIAGAVLDVFREEPLPEAHPFWTTPGIVITPHIGGGHPRRDAIVAGLYVENLRRYLGGEPLLMQVDREKGY